jgi:hypothetical protein
LLTVFFIFVTAVTTDAMSNLSTEDSSSTVSGCPKSIKIIWGVLLARIMVMVSFSTGGKGKMVSKGKGFNEYRRYFALCHFDSSGSK